MVRAPHAPSNARFDALEDIFLSADDRSIAVGVVNALRESV
jgi:hypothetical protein